MIGRIIGLDIGDRRIGISVSDPLGFTAQGVESYTRPDDDLAADIAHLVAVFKKYAPYRIVLGMPRNMNGTYGPQAEKIMAFRKVLEEAYPCEYDFFDERLTTASAQRMLISADVSRKKRKQVVDKIAADIILQDYLDSGAPARPVVKGDFE